MGKASRSKRSRRNGPPAVADRSRHLVDDLFRSLQVPAFSVADYASHDPTDMFGADFARSWRSLPSRNTLALRDEQTAAVLGIGLRGPLLKEVIGTLARLTDRPSSEDFLIVDVGSGTGVLGIALQRLTGSDVLLLDPDPQAAVIGQAFAGRVGAPVQTATAGMRDLPEVLDGCVPGLVVAQGILFDTAQRTHDHNPGISWELSVRHRLATPEDVGSDLLTLLECSRHSTFALLDFCCAELLASIIGHAARVGLQFDTQRSALLGAKTEHPQFCAVFTPHEPPRLPEPDAVLNLRYGTKAYVESGVPTAWPAERMARDDERPEVRRWQQRSGLRVGSQATIKGDKHAASLYVTHDNGDRHYLTLTGPQAVADLTDEAEAMMTQMGGRWEAY